jgi:D-3-phosphoglycerate dehydrogenase
MRYKVVITDLVAPGLEPERRVLADIAELVVAPAQDADSILAAARDADAVLNTYAKLPGPLLKQLSRCRIVARYGIGVDTVDIPVATALGILVTNVPDYCIEEVADHALALILCITRKVVLGTASVKGGTWDIRVAMPLARHRGRTLGLAGFGKIPQALAPRVKAMGFTVIAYDPYVPPDAAAAAGVRLVDFDTLLAESDVISIHAPLTAETRGLFGTSAFGKMKRGAFVVNTSRGPLVDTDALTRALQSGHLAGAGLDVLETEPPPRDHPLLQLPNVAITPHTGFYSEQSLEELQTKAAQNVRSALTGQTPRYVVNRDVLPAARALAVR